MRKLLEAYKVNPSYANAVKLRKYDRAHAMAACLLPKEDGDLLADAIHHANKGSNA